MQRLAVALARRIIVAAFTGVKIAPQHAMHRSALADHQMTVQEESRGFLASMTACRTQAFHLGAGAEIQGGRVLNH